MKKTRDTIGTFLVFGGLLYIAVTMLAFLYVWFIKVVEFLQ